MISLRVLFFVTLTVGGLDYVRAQIRWNSPVSFNYVEEDTFDIDITLQNVPPVANHFLVCYETANGDISTRTEKPNYCYGTGKTGPIPKDGFNFVGKLYRRNMKLFIEISSSNKTCSTKRIMVGVRDSVIKHASKTANPFRACLNSYGSRCEISVDFQDTCNETFVAKLVIKYLERKKENAFICMIAGLVIGKTNCVITQSRGHLACESSDVQLPDDIKHQWYQGYNNDSFIGAIPTVKGTKTKFVMQYYQFDLNTYIHSKMSSTQWKTDLKFGLFEIPLSTTGYKKYDVTSKKSYSESEEVHFTCSNKLHTQVGWIDPTGYRITTYSRISFSWTFKKEQNNSIWCCINYITYTNGSETTVERTVEDITVLIYKEPVNQYNVNGTDNKTSVESAATVGQWVWLGVVLGVAVILGIWVTLCIIKCRRIEPNTQELPQAYVPNQPFYLNLLFRKECEREIYEREHIYEEID